MVRQCIPLSAVAGSVYLNEEGHDIVERGDSPVPDDVGSAVVWNVRGCTNLGIGVSAGGPVAILSGSLGDRPHCIYRNFCVQGCKIGAKASTSRVWKRPGCSAGSDRR